MDEDGLKELLDLIAGRGRWAWVGGSGFHTHPGMDDSRATLHAACLELESRGLITRIISNPRHVCWRALV